MKKIKILYIINTLNTGGITNCVVDLCNKLDRDKYEITLLLLSDNRLIERDKIDSHTRVIVMPTKYRARIVVNIAILSLMLPRIWWLMRQIKPDIVHTHEYQYNSLPALWAMRLALPGVNHFHTIHTTGLHYFNSNSDDKLKLKVENYYYKKCSTNLICVSKDVERNVLKYFDGFKSETVIANGIDTAKFDHTKFEHSDGSGLRLVYVSRLVPGKNHATLLRAMAALRDRYDDIHLTLIGDGELRDELENYVADNGLAANVEFLGSRNDVVELLSRADVGVFPSEYEGFSIALVEMMAMRLAIICSDIQNFRDVSQQNGDLMFFDLFDGDMLASKIEMLYVDRAKLKLQQDRAYNLSKKYTIEQSIAKYDKYYNQIINETSIHNTK